jgi:hypothetical protein
LTGFSFSCQDNHTVLDFVHEHSIGNVIVLSGDQHTAAIDDGTNAGLPEVMAGGLDITNLKIVALFKAFGINIWNKGGQGISTQEFNNAYGRITVFGSDSVHLALIDEFGTKFASHTGVNRMTGFEVKNSTPTSFALVQNYPNPFNPTTALSFVLGHSSFVTLKVFDLLGREVTMLLNKEKRAGTHSVQFDASHPASGVYYYRMQAGDFADVKKFVVLK